MIFGWRDKAEPQPELVPEAREALERAHQLLDQDNRASAIAVLEQAGEAGEQAQTAEGLAMAAEAFELLATLHEERGATAAAREALEGAVRTGQGSGTPDGLAPAARASHALAEAHAERSESEQAREAIERTLELADQAATTEAHVVAARAARLAGELAAERGRFDEAIEWLEQAVDRGSGTGNLAGIETAARAGGALGRVLHERGDAGHAIQALEQASALGASTGTQAGTLAQAIAELERGRIEADRGDHAAAGQALERAGELVDPLGTPEAEAIVAAVRLAEGEIAEHSGELRRASDLYAEAAVRGADSGLADGIEAGQQARSRNMELSLPPEQEPAEPTAERAGIAGTTEATATTETAETTEITETAETVERAKPDPEPEQAPEQAPAPQEAVEPTVTPPSWTPPTGQDPWLALDRADTIHEIAVRRRDEASLTEALQTIEAALDEHPGDARLLIRRARFQALLGRWRHDRELLAMAADDFARAFEIKGGRVDPRTHDPGPVFFFEWGRALYELGELTDDPDRFAHAHQRLSTGYDMTPRGAHHSIASAITARCLFHLAQAGREPEGYAQAIERYRALEEQGASFALEAEDHATWARSLMRVSERTGDLATAQEAFERMERAYDRSA